MARRSAAAVLPLSSGARPVRAMEGAQGAHRVPLGRYVLQGEMWTVLTAPVIYLVAVPFALLDAAISIYQAVCFRAWGIRRVRRRTHFVIDRHRLPYLNALERLNCMYCSYANGVLAYVSEVAARTEQYWCPIRHARAVRHRPRRYAGFAAYGDGRAYRDRLPLFRAALKR